ncbi:MAG: murein biosynthesis integral membrane protein MurJ, partial [Deltaproteobacteria bacterium]|nr:murein biosynthesis integral membrane protein MurJ [Deltaproteobacteria bacterium]
MSKKHDILGAFGVIGLSTLASRILGLVREMVIAFLFGAGMSADAFFVAFQIPNTFRRLMAEGSLTIAFVPVFSDTMIKKGRREAEALANAVFTLLTISLIVLTIAGILFSSPLIKVMVWGWEQAGIPGKIELTVLLTRIMFPYVFFISLVAFCMGVLNSLKHFAAPALSPALLNLSMILSAILLYPYCNPPILALAAGVIVGGFLQLILQIPFLMQKGIHLVFDFSLQHPGLRRIGSLMVYGVFGSAVYQINIIITRFLAS